MKTLITILLLAGSLAVFAAEEPLEVAVMNVNTESAKRLAAYVTGFSDALSQAAETGRRALEPLAPIMAVVFDKNLGEPRDCSPETIALYYEAGFTAGSAALSTRSIKTLKKR